MIRRVSKQTRLKLHLTRTGEQVDNFFFKQVQLSQEDPKTVILNVGTHAPQGSNLGISY